MKTPSTPVQKCNCKNHIGNFMPLDCRQCAEYHGYEYQPSESKRIEKDFTLYKAVDDKEVFNKLTSEEKLEALRIRAIQK